MEAPRDIPSKASRPVLSGRGRPLPVSGFHGFRSSVRESILTHSRSERSRSDQLGCGRLLLSVPGRLDRFYCSLELVCQVCWARFPCKIEALRSVHHVHVLL